jgi:hypothetical protein
MQIKTCSSDRRSSREGSRQLYLDGESPQMWHFLTQTGKARLHWQHDFPEWWVLQLSTATSQTKTPRSLCLCILWEIIKSTVSLALFCIKVSGASAGMTQWLPCCSWCWRITSKMASFTHSPASWTGKLMPQPLPCGHPTWPSPCVQNSFLEVRAPRTSVSTEAAWPSMT